MMESAQQAVVQKATRLAALVGATVPSPPSPGTPAEVLAALRTVARAAVSVATPRGGLPIVVSDLFAFLLDLPPGLETALSAEGAPSPPPARAWEEPAAEDLWRLAALVQDVWAHTLGEEAAADEDLLARVLRAGPARVYDFGCGAGHLAFELARHRVEVTCVDRDRVRRAFVRFRKGRHPEGARVHLRPAGSPWDLLLAIDVLDHLEDPVGAIPALAARLRPGGLLVLRAAFPDDGWHRGGEEWSEAVGRELFRFFRHPATSQDPGGETALLVRRDRPLPQGAEGRPQAAQRVRLHPAAILAPAPGLPDHYVLAAPRFYTRPLVLDPMGAEVAGLCRRGSSLEELCAAAPGRDGATVHRILDHMRAARLLLVDDDGGGDEVVAG